MQGHSPPRLESPPHWPDAACYGMVPDLFYPPINSNQHAYRMAIDICDHCSHELECLTFALETNESHGVWGGTSARDRNRLRRLKRLRDQTWGELAATYLSSTIKVTRS